jgi:phospholipid transport system substrate-binding protein
VRWLLTATLVVGSLLGAPCAWAASPTDELRGYVDRVLAMLDAPDMQGPARATDRTRAARSLAGQGLDFHEAAKRALGTHWQTRAPDERTQFVTLFTALIDHAYLSTLSGYKGERLRYDTESVTGEEALVKARVLEKDGGVTPIEFQLVRGGDGRGRTSPRDYGRGQVERGSRNLM